MESITYAFAMAIGRNTIKKDSHLLYLVMNPDFPPVHITPFDEETLRDGFMLRAGGIPGVSWSPSLIIFTHSPSEDSLALQFI
jgi:hypothetical protein